MQCVLNRKNKVSVSLSLYLSVSVPHSSFRIINFLYLLTYFCKWVFTSFILISSMFLFGELIKSPFFHLFGKLFLCQPFISPSVHLFDELCLLDRDFCAIHLFGELSSCRPFNSPSFGKLFSCQPFNCPFVHPFGELFCVVHPLDELFSCRPFNSPSVHFFGELFLCRPSLG